MRAFRLLWFPVFALYLFCYRGIIQYYGFVRYQLDNHNFVHGEEIHTLFTDAEFFAICYVVLILAAILFISQRPRLNTVSKTLLIVLGIYLFINDILFGYHGDTLHTLSNILMTIVPHSEFERSFRLYFTLIVIPLPFVKIYYDSHPDPLGILHEH